MVHTVPGGLECGGRDRCRPPPAGQEAEEDTEGSLPGDNQSGGGGGGTPAALMSEHLELKKTVLITVYTK